MLISKCHLNKSNKYQLRKKQKLLSNGFCLKFKKLYINLKLQCSNTIILI